jgi:hypothetical protein
MNAYNLLRLVQRHGSTLTLHKVSEGTYDPATGSLVGSAEDTYEITAYMYDAVVGPAAGTDIVRGVKKVVIPALGLPVEPDDGDYISGLGDAVYIKLVTTHYSAGIPILYSCEVSE